MVIAVINSKGCNLNSRAGKIIEALGDKSIPVEKLDANGIVEFVHGGGDSIAGYILEFTITDLPTGIKCIKTRRGIKRSAVVAELATDKEDELVHFITSSMQKYIADYFKKYPLKI